MTVQIFSWQNFQGFANRNLLNLRRVRRSRSGVRGANNPDAKLKTISDLGVLCASVVKFPFPL